ncbi:MAG: hypothetical protein JNM18_22775 [Planctomycetaceae bacterium]|nr:hypothetical protein [Planctomycetaceae bacterium]
MNRSQIIHSAMILWGLSALVGNSTSGEECERPRGQATIRSREAADPIVITTTERLAGAIHSLTWNGQEFIDSADHGRQLQSASNLDLSTPFSAETFNPTEAGSRADGAGPTSSSRLLHFLAGDDWLQSTNQMAFWLRPSETSGGHPAKNTAIVSDHLVTKRVQIGYKQLPQVITYDVTFTLPLGEQHSYAQFEAVTGYMPPVFEKFWRYLPAKETLDPLGDGPGEQRYPVVLATASGSHAMGIFSPDQPASGFENAGYGRWRFGKEKVVKWNSVFRVRNPAGIAAGEYRYRNFVAVGDLESVRRSLSVLHDEFGRR